MREKFLRVLAFAAGVGILLFLLRFFNWLPLMVQTGSMRGYRDLEEARGALQIRTILVPSYFPQHLQWPPSRILAQKKPFPAVVMEFEKMGSKVTTLLISQSTSEGFLPEEKIRFVQVNETVAYSLKGREATLRVGVCHRNETCSGISWKEGEYRIRVLALSTPFELIKIAESMLR
jgi:hypothetical protein